VPLERHQTEEQLAVQLETETVDRRPDAPLRRRGVLPVEPDDPIAPDVLPDTELRGSPHAALAESTVGLQRKSLLAEDSDCIGGKEFGHDRPALRGEIGDQRRAYSAVVGSIIVLMRETRLAGKPPCWAC